MLFIGTQFSILYTSMYSLAEAATQSFICGSSHALWNLRRVSSSIHHDDTLLVHPQHHVNSVQFSFHDTLLPPPILPAGVSSLVNFSIGFILYPFFCFRLSMFFLASIVFSTEDSLSHVFNPSWCAVPLHWSRLAPHNPIFLCLDCLFAFCQSNQRNMRAKPQ